MITAKILMLGEIGVGKTSIARRLVLDAFEQTYKATIGTDIYRHEIVPSPVGEPFHCIIWDTDGNFGETIFRHVYARQADAAVIVGDVTRPSTLESAAMLGAGFMESFPGRPLTYLANKSDLLAEGVPPVLPPDLISEDVPIVTTSARTGHHVRQAFRDLAVIIARRR